jgi:hypothetical protein
MKLYIKEDDNNPFNWKQQIMDEIEYVLSSYKNCLGDCNIWVKDNTSNNTLIFYVELSEKIREENHELLKTLVFESIKDFKDLFEKHGIILDYYAEENKELTSEIQYIGLLEVPKYSATYEYRVDVCDEGIPAYEDNERCFTFRLEPELDNLVCSRCSKPLTSHNCQSSIVHAVSSEEDRYEGFKWRCFCSFCWPIVKNKTVDDILSLYEPSTDY